MISGEDMEAMSDNEEATVSVVGNGVTDILSRMVGADNTVQLGADLLAASLMQLYSWGVSEEDASLLFKETWVKASRVVDNMAELQKENVE